MPENDDLLDEAFGDLLGGTSVEPVNKPATVVAPAAPVAPKAPAAAPAPASAPKKDDMGMVPFGTKINTVPIPRFKATKAVKSRIAFLSKGVLPLKTHYVNGIGSFVCFGGKCCELEGLPKVRYIAPIIVYETDKTGRVISQNISLNALVLGEDSYSALADAINFSGKSPQEIDVIITCSDENYQKLSFTVDNSQAPQWKTFQAAKDLVAFYKENKSRLYMAVARTLEESTYLSKKGFVVPNSQAPVVDDPNDLLDD